MILKTKLNIMNRATRTFIIGIFMVVFFGWAISTSYIELGSFYNYRWHDWVFMGLWGYGFGSGIHKVGKTID